MIKIFRVIEIGSRLIRIFFSFCAFGLESTYVRIWGLGKGKRSVSLCVCVIVFFSFITMEGQFWVFNAVSLYRKKLFAKEIFLYNTTYALRTNFH